MRVRSGLNAPPQAPRVSHARRLAALLASAAIALAVALWLPAPAKADFGISTFNVQATTESGAPDNLAGSHPYALTTTIGFNLAEESRPPGGPSPTATSATSTSPCRPA